MVPSPKRLSTTAIVLLVGFLTFLVGLGIGLGRGTYANNDRAVRRIADGSASSSWVVSGIGSEPSDDIDSTLDFEQFWEVWRDIKAHYKEPVDDKTLFYGALQGLTNAVNDPYTTFFLPSEAQTFEDDLKGQFSGIGAEIGMKDDQIQIISPLSGSPAEQAGLRAGDIILKIDGTDTIGLSVVDAVMRIRGEQGTTVTLTIGRDSSDGRDLETIDIAIVRDIITIKSAELKDRGDGIFVIEIRSFNEDVAATFNELVDQALAKNAKGIVIDVRNDPGGYLDRAVQIIGEWIPDKDVVLQRKQGEIVERYKGEGSGRLAGMPTVVLINEGSASASEILAGALQDYDVATIIGKRSFGKGSVQDYLEYTDGSAMKITVSEWLTPKERSIDKEGISPDIEIDITEEEYNADKDPQLDKAVEILKAGGRS